MLLDLGPSLFIFCFFFSIHFVFVMHKNIEANSLHVKTYLAITFILIRVCVWVCVHVCCLLCELRAGWV